LFACGPADATAIPSSLASLKYRLILLFCYQLTQVVLEKRPLNRCSSSSTVVVVVIINKVKNELILSVVQKGNKSLECSVALVYSLQGSCKSFSSCLLLFYSHLDVSVKRFMKINK